MNGRMPLSAIAGSCFVRRTPRASKDCNKLFPLIRDRMILRRHVLKLAYWPESLDLEWEWIKAVRELQIGELRIDEVIGGRDNLRVIFFCGGGDFMIANRPVIWLLTVYPKKRDEFTKAEITAFKTMRHVLIERYYRR